MANGQNMKTLNTKILLRTDTTAGWNKAVELAPGDVILLKGEIGVEILTDGKKKIKIGDASTSWENLDYFGSSAAINAETDPVNEKADIGTIWVNTVNGKIFISVKEGVWQQLGTSEDLNTTYTLKSVTGAENEGKLEFAAKNPDSSKNIIFKGAGNVKVTSDGDAVTITGTDKNDNTTYELKTTQSSTEGLLKLIDNNKVENTIKLQKEGNNVEITSTDAGIIKISATDTGATSIGTDGDGVAVNGADYDTSSRKITLHKGFKETAVTVTDATQSNGLITAIKKGIGSHTIESEKGVTYTTAIAGTGNDTSLPTTKAVNDFVATKMSTVDAMRYKGTVDNSHDLPASGVKKGDTYKVAFAKSYSGIAAKVGDLFIANADNASTSAGWDLIPSGDDGNTFHSTLTANTVVLAENENKIKTLANGTNGQVLKIVSGVPTWAKDEDTKITKATDNTLGGFETGYGENGKNYAVKMSENKAFVTVDWKNDTYAAGTDISLSGASPSQTINVAYTKNNFTTQMNNDADILVLNGGKASGWDK